MVNEEDINPNKLLIEETVNKIKKTWKKFNVELVDSINDNLYKGFIINGATCDYMVSPYYDKIIYNYRNKVKMDDIEGIVKLYNSNYNNGKPFYKFLAKNKNKIISFDHNIILYLPFNTKFIKID